MNPPTGPTREAREARQARDDPAHRLAAAFGQQAGRWAAAQGADAGTAAIAAAAARALSLATSDGHVCTDLDALRHEAGIGPALDRDGLRAALLASGVVGPSSAPGAMPLVLDDDGRLYLHRYHDYEQRLARRLIAAAHEPAAATDEMAGPLRAQLRTLFAPNAARLRPGEVDGQQLAAALALRRHLTVISGGPGTGKTTTVVNLLACLLAQNPDCRIVLAAPTGKAAARMSEAIRQRAAQLPPALRERLPAEASTIHRLLGVRLERSPGPGFVHHAGNPLALDALVIDEASMLDLALATQLLEAVPAGARIVLLGDKDQLSAVESGAVFSELSADPRLGPACREDLARLCGAEPASIQPPAPARESALQDSVVWFTQNFRFARDSGIGRLAAGINQGLVDETLSWLGERDDPSLLWLDDAAPAPQPATWRAIREAYAPYRDTVMREAAQPAMNPAALAAAFDRFRVLCALRNGPRGAVAINEALSREMRAALGPTHDTDPRSPWYAGRPVMVLRNDATQRLYNGDIGIAAPGAAGDWRVHFPEPDGSFRAIAVLRLPEHQTAYAMTVHKAQGSEFDEVLLLMPAQPGRIATRELLYTAVTRARQRVAIAGGRAVLAAAMATATQRRSGLLARLREASAAAGPPAA